MKDATAQDNQASKTQKKKASKWKIVFFVLLLLLLLPLIFRGSSSRFSLFTINLNKEELPETGIQEVIDIWVNDTGDTISGDLEFLDADLDIGENSIVTAQAEIISEELEVLEEGVSFEELEGQLQDEQISDGAVDLDSSEVEGVLPIASGGTNASSFDSSEFIWYSGTSLTASGYNNTSFMTSGTDNWVNTSGDTMSGNLTISSGNDLILDNSGDLLFGTTYLNESTSPTDSGAYIVGVFDEFSNSNSTNVQDVLDDLDQAIAIGGILPDSLDYTELEDALDLDANTSLTAGTYNYTLNLNNTGDFTIQDNSTTHWQFRDDGNLYASSDAMLNMGGNRVENVGNPNSGDDAVNLTYANSQYINDGAGEIDNSNDFNFAAPTSITNLDADTLDTIDSASFLRSDASDNYTSGTLTFDAGTTLDINGNLTVLDQTIPFEAATFSAFDLTGDLRVLATGDDDDYIYFNTTSDAPSILWEGVLAYSNDPGFRINTTSGEIEYRDEDEPGWTSIDSLAGGASLWTDLGTELTPAGDESIQLDDGDWIGVGSGADQPFLTFDDTNNYFEFMGGNVGIGTTAPGTLLDVSGGSIRTNNQLISTVSTSTPPLAISSSTLVSNLNSDLLDNQEGSYYQNASNINAGTLGTGYFSAYSDLNAEGYVPASSTSIWTDTNDGSTSGLDADTLDTIDSASFLRSDASDNYTSGTLTFDAGTTLDINGNLTVLDQTIPFEAATFTAFDLTGDLRVLSTGDDDDYIYFNTASDAPSILWEGVLAYSNDPGFRINTTSGEIEYRDEDEPGWTSIDSLAGGSSLWTDLGTELTPAGDESIQLDDGDWIGVGSGANQPYLTFDDSNDYFEFMGGNVGIGSTSPSALLTTSGTTEQLRLEYNASNYQSFTVQSDGDLHIAQNGAAATLALTDSGRVGIGTTAPGHKVDIAGNVNTQNEIVISESFEDVTFPPTGWTTGGDVNWFRDTGDYQEGLASACSGDISDNQTSWLDRDYTFTTAGEIRFYWKVSSEADYDYLVFCVDNDSCTMFAGYTHRIEGTVDWTEVSYPVSAGSHSFRWIYSKDSSASSGTDEGWIDNVRFIEGGSAFVNSGLLANNSSSGSLAFQTAGTNRMLIDSSGNVGVGVIPSYYFEIYKNSPVSSEHLFHIGTSADPDRFYVDEGGSVTMDGDLTINGSDVREAYGSLRLSGEENVYIAMDYNNDDADTRVIAFGKNDEGGDTNWSELMRIDEDGDVGIGTTTPDASLDVGTGAVKTGSGYAVGTRQGSNYRLEGGTTSCTANTYHAGTQVYYCQTSVTFSTSYSSNPIVVSGFSGTALGGYVTSVSTTGFTAHIAVPHGSGYTITQNWLAYGLTTATDFDLAESYRTKDQSIESGDVVCIDPDHNSHIVKCSKPYDSTAIGIVSTEPGLVIGDDLEETSRLVGLQGRVPVKVTLENGPIERGDPLAPSATKPGFAMKAIKGGQIIGKALQPFNGTSTVLGENAFDGLEEDNINKLISEIKETGEGQTLAFINISWYEPESYLDKLDQIIFDYDSGLLNSTAGSIDTLSNLTITNTLTANSIQAQDGTFASIQVGNISVSGNLDVTGLLTSNQIKTGMLQSFDSENLVIKLSEDIGNTALEIQNSLGETVFSVDSTGKLTIKADVEGASVGTGEFDIGKTEVRIETSAVNENSKVFVTSIYSHKDIPTLSTKEKGNGYFIVHIEEAKDEKVEFDWWVIN